MKSDFRAMAYRVGVPTLAILGLGIASYDMVPPLVRVWLAEHYIGLGGVGLVGLAFVARWLSRQISTDEPGGTGRADAARTDDNVEVWVSQEIDHYREGTHDNFWLYFACKLPVLVLGAALPVVVMSDEPKMTAAIMAAIVTVLEGYLQLFRIHEAWLNNGMTAQLLENEMRQYAAASGSYEKAGTAAERKRLLAERATQAIHREWQQWFARHQKPMASPDEPAKRAT